MLSSRRLFAATVKVDKTKAFTFTPTTSYTPLKKDMKASAVLTGKVNVNEGEYTVAYVGLQNMNTKGVTNHFTNYFVIENGEIKWTGKEGYDPKSDLTGYLTYKAEAATGYLSNGKGTGTNTVKITVKFDDKKTAAQYSQPTSGNSIPEIGNVKGQTAALS